LTFIHAVPSVFISQFFFLEPKKSFLTILRLAIHGELDFVVVNLISVDVISGLIIRGSFGNILGDIVLKFKVLDN
jgi:hypothetical protein